MVVGKEDNKKMKPQIYIIGTGAIGKALALFLKEEDRNVILVRGSVDNQPEKKIKIAVTNQNNQRFEQEVTTTTISNIDRIDGIILIATKTFSNIEIAKKLKGKKGIFSIVLLQNGLNIEEPFKDFKEVYRCVLFSTSQVMKDNRILFKTVKSSPIGRIKAEKTQTEEIVTQINTNEFQFKIEKNINNIVWNKVIINCAYNSICPLLEVDNGIFHKNSDALNLAKEIIDECVGLASEYGVDLDKGEIEEQLLLISQRADGQLISTYEDIRRNRRTEIDSLNLEISRLSDKIGQPDLTIKTKLLGKMISIKSNIKVRQRLNGDI